MRSKYLIIILLFTYSLLESSLVTATGMALAELPTLSQNVSILMPEDSAAQDQYVSPLLPPVNAKIEVNIAARQMKVFHQGKIVFEFPVAVGAVGFKTPVSQREMKQIIWNPWWLPPDSPWAKNDKPTPPGPNNPLGPVKMDLGNAILFHGTNKPQSVGRAASHGCMRMKNEDAKTLAWWIQSNFTDKSDPALLNEYAAKKGRSFYVKLETPIPVEIKYELFERKNDLVIIHPDVYGRVANKKVKFKEWLVSEGMEANLLNENQLVAFMTQVKKDSLPVLMQDLLLSTSNTSISGAEETGAAVVGPKPKEIIF